MDVSEVSDFGMNEKRTRAWIRLSKPCFVSRTIIPTLGSTSRL